MNASCRCAPGWLEIGARCSRIRTTSRRHPRRRQASSPSLRNRCLAAGIKPIAFNRSLDLPLASWLDHAINDDSLVVLNNDGEEVIDMAEYALASHLDSLRQSFVSLIDERGRVQMTVKYRPLDGERSMTDVIELVTALRNGSCRKRAS